MKADQGSVKPSRFRENEKQSSSGKTEWVSDNEMQGMKTECLDALPNDQ